jgi:hypothetical protein
MISLSTSKLNIRHQFGSKGFCTVRHISVILWFGCQKSHHVRTVCCILIHLCASIAGLDVSHIGCLLEITELWSPKGAVRYSCALPILLHGNTC